MGKNKRLIQIMALVLTLVILLSAVTVLTSVLFRLNKGKGDESTNADPQKDNYIPNDESIIFDEEANLYYVNDELMVFFENGTSEEQINSFINEIGGTHVGTIPDMGLYQIKLSDAYSLSELAAYGDEITETYDCVLYATYDSAVKDTNAFDTESDPYIPDDPWNGDVNEDDWTDIDVDGSNWWIEVMNIPMAWTASANMDIVNIGICDKGYDISHEDLSGKCSFVNDLSTSNNPEGTKKNDPRYHGTFMAGIIGAIHNNKTGLSGIVDRCNLKLAAYGTAPGTARNCYAFDSSIYANLHYLIDADCRIINLSQGKSSFVNDSNLDFQKEMILRDARLSALFISRMIESGKDDFVIVQSAGNGDKNNHPINAVLNCWFCSVTDDTPTFSDTVSIKEIRSHIVVVGAASNSGDGYSRRDDTNFGKQIDVFAPGENIYSTTPGNKYETQGQTSCAAAIISGVLALIWGNNPSLTAGEIKEILCSEENSYIPVEDDKDENEHWMPDAYLAVDAARGHVSDPENESKNDNENKDNDKDNNKKDPDDDGDEEKKAEENQEESHLSLSIRDSAPISAGWVHTVGVKSDGTVLATGNNEKGECDVSGWTDIVQVSSHGEHTVGLKKDGTVVAVGDNDHGECEVDGWTDIVAVSAGQFNTVGLKKDGTVVATDIKNPDPDGVKVNYGQSDVDKWTDIIAISCGYVHTVGLKQDGTVVAAGLSEHGRCNVGDWTDITAISAGAFHTVGLKSDGTVVATSFPDQFGDKGQCSVGYWQNVTAISAGYNHTVALTSDGKVLSTGDNTLNDCKTSGDKWQDVVAVSAGYHYTIGLKSDGSVISVGRDIKGKCEVGDWNLN